MGRRSALGAFPSAALVELAPIAPPPAASVHRFDDEQHEADWLALQIQDLLRDGAVPENIAVLTRAVHTAALYAGFLRDRGIDASLPGSLLERDDELADLLALCAVVDDPLDQAHLLRVLASPMVGLSDASLWALCKDPAQRLQLSLEVGAQTMGEPLATPRRDTLARNVLHPDGDAILDEPARTRIAQLRLDLQRWRAHCAGISPVERLVYLASTAGFRDRWRAAPAVARERLAMDLARVSAAVVQAGLTGVSSFCEIAELVENDVLALAPAGHVAGAVVTDSIVAVKGLRFDHVFVVGVAHERFPRIYTSHAMAFSRTYGLIVRENIAGGAAQTAKFAWYYARFAAKSMYLDEERRALRYGLSRARSSAQASGFGTPPRWARGHDLLAWLEAGRPEEAL